MTQAIDADAAALLASGAVLVEGVGGTWVDAYVADISCRRVRFVRGIWRCSCTRPASTKPGPCVHVRAVMAVTAPGGHRVIDALQREAAARVDQLRDDIQRPKGGTR